MLFRSAPARPRPRPPVTTTTTDASGDPQPAVEPPVIERRSIRISVPGLGAPLAGEPAALRLTVDQRRQRMGDALPALYDAVLSVAPDALIERTPGARVFLPERLAASEPLSRDDFYDYSAFIISRAFPGGEYDPAILPRLTPRIRSIAPEGVLAWRRVLTDATGGRVNRATVALHVAGIDELFKKDRYENSAAITSLIERVERIPRPMQARFAERFPEFRCQPVAVMVAIARPDAFFDADRKFDAAAFDDALATGAIAGSTQR